MAHDLWPVPSLQGFFDQPTEREGLAHIRRALDEDGLDRAPVFERGLDWLIAGIEASIG